MEFQHALVDFANTHTCTDYLVSIFIGRHNGVFEYRNRTPYELGSTNAIHDMFARMGFLFLPIDLLLLCLAEMISDDFLITSCLGSIK